MTKLTLSLADDFLDNVKIPPQPEILICVQNELQKEHPDINLISDNICKDGSLFSSLLRLINSPYFGIRCEIQSIPHAISLIGVENLTTNIACIKFRDQMKQSGYVSMPRYWDHATDMAKACCYLSEELAIVEPHSAYALGLFYDCGIPILSSYFDNYKEVLKEQNLECLENYTELEDKTFNTNHCIVAYLVTKKWGLDDALRDACRFHHDIEYITDKNWTKDQRARKLIMILKLAEYVLHSKRNESFFEWTNIESYVLNYLGLSEHDFYELKDELIDYLNGV